MAFDFVEKVMCIGSGSTSPTIQFYKKGFNIGDSGSQPTWQDIILSGNTALTLVNAKANGLEYLKLFGGTEQRNLPSEYTQVEYVTNTAQTLVDTGVKFDFAKNYEIELRVRGVTGSWYILQAREDADSPTNGISGSQTGNKISLNFNGISLPASRITRVAGHIYYLKGTINNGNLTLYVKDETAGTEETVTRTYTVTTGQSVNICLFGNLAENYVGNYSNVYFVQIKEDGNYIMDYVPCKQSTTAGFYDKVSSTFKTATNLSAGSDVVPTPDNPIDIVCNNGVVKVSPNLLDVNNIEGNFLLTDLGQIGNENSEWFTTNFIKVTPNTRYCFDFISGSDTQFRRICGYSSNNYNSFTELLVKKYKPTVVGTRYTETFTTSATTNYIKLSSVVNDTNKQIVEGSTATPYMPYGIYTDGTTETVEITGKNLFDKNQTYISAFVNTNTGELTRGSNQKSFVVNCLPNTTYTLSGMTAVSGWGSFTSSTIGTIATSFIAGNGTITTGANDKYLIGLAYVGNGALYDYRNTLQIELGSTATTYKPYFNGGTATAENLFKIGTYQDIQSVIDGSVTRNIGIMVLDGTEDWTRQTGNYPYFCVDYDTDFALSTNTYGGFCSHFECVNTGATQNNQGISLYKNSATNKTRLGLKYNDLYPATDANIPLLKQYLADQYASGTPVIFVYPLATATTETVTAQPMDIQAGTNIVEITQASIDNLELEVKYKATV